MYIVKFSKSAQEFLEEQSRKIQLQIAKKIELLRINPRPSGCKKIEGRENTYRLRSGDYRIIYEIRETEIIIYVFTVGHRSDIYRFLNY